MPRKASSAPTTTAEHILDAAEPLFADHGYHGTTLRQVTKAAGANLASVNYHHRSKEALYRAVVRRRLHAIDQGRLAELELAEARATGAPVPVATLLDILARPLFERAGGTACDARAARLLGRSLAEPLPFMDEFLQRELSPVLARFGQALRRHFPAEPPDRFLWRLNFIVGSLHHTVASMHRMSRLTDGLCREQDAAKALALFVNFSAAGLESVRHYRIND